MRILVLSDLHLEFSGNNYLRKLPDPSAYDVVVLAGDISLGTKGAEWAVKTFEKDIIYIAGNHEFYNRDYDTVIAELEDFNNIDGFYFLNNNHVEIDNVIFYGGTMWTSCITNDLPIKENNINYIKSQMNDFNVIMDGDKLFTVENSIELFNTFESELQKVSANKGNKKLVVVSHHLPKSKLINAKWQGSPLNAGFASEIDSYGANLWIFGHTHDSIKFFDYESNCSYICNPYGYSGYEVNPEFDEELILEV